MKGKFITFEGPEGSGKSTQIKFVFEFLKKNKYPVVFLREPGGVKISEQIRRILLDVKSKGMCDECETLLYMASRAQLVQEKILPALRAGKMILCDRFLDSTIVYQGYGNGVDISFIKKIGDFVTRGVKPDLTFVFDIDPRQGFSRIRRAKDRIEQRSLAYHRRIRRGYKILATQEPGRIKLIAGGQDKEAVRRAVLESIQRLLK